MLQDAQVRRGASVLRHCRRIEAHHHKVSQAEHHGRDRHTRGGCNSERDRERGKPRPPATGAVRKRPGNPEAGESHGSVDAGERDGRPAETSPKPSPAYRQVGAVPLGQAGANERRELAGSGKNALPLPLAERGQDLVFPGRR